jgi:hypothetical protein
MLSATEIQKGTQKIHIFLEILWLTTLAARLAFSDLDGPTNAGKFVNSIKNDLEAQIGNPSPRQQILSRRSWNQTG